MNDLIYPPPRDSRKPEVSSEVLSKWQTVANLAAAIINVPAGLVMRVHHDSIEVLISSETDNNPYTPGDSEKLNSGLYCETVMGENQPLHIPNALEDPDWAENPDISLGMISYLGFPLRWPDGEVFGTICVLDTGTNHYGMLQSALLERLRDAIESDLKAMHALQELEHAHAHIKQLSELVPICANCHKIRDDHDYWRSLESYIEAATGKLVTHGLCPHCAEEFDRELDEEVNKSSGR